MALGTEENGDPARYLLLIYTPMREGDSELAKIKWNWPFIIAFLIVFGAANIGFLAYSTSNHFCGSLCKSQRIYRDTWLVSSHGPQVLKDHAVSCKHCHTDPGLMGFITAKIQGVPQLVKEVTATYKTPIKGEPKEVRCRECHDTKKINETETLKIPHEIHEAMGLNCMSCHAGLVHGHEGEGEAKITHDACKQCHDTEKQEDCTKCHKW
jgi:nitrate/TMAO reductase-like tetraheme cytochrome c subunit